MKLVVKMRLQDLEIVNRYLEIFKIPVAPQIADTEIEEKGVSEIVDTLFFLDMPYYALQLYMHSYSRDVLERTLIIADELKIRYIAANIPLKMLKHELNSLFDLFSSYKNNLCIETAPRNVEKVKDTLLDKIGGVLWVKIMPDALTSTRELKEALRSSMRLVKIIEAANFEEKGKKKIKILKKGRINYYNVLKFLSREFYNDIFLIPYDKSIYKIPQELINEYNVLLQFYNSTYEQ